MKARDSLPDSENQDSFELVELVGRDGFAHTYRARVLDQELIDEYETDEIALKIPSAGKQRALVGDFVMNAPLHVRLRENRSTNLLRCFGIETFHGQLVVAMEYAPKGSLRKKLGPIGRQKRLDIAEAVEIAVGVLNGVSTLHHEHILHGNIHPESILMDGRTPKVDTLGIARLLDSNELAPAATGALYYMSPEILVEGGVDFISDLWSVSVTLYEMTTGTLPFGNENTPMRTMDLIRKAEPVPAHELCPDVPKGLSELILKALQKDPDKRFKSADEMRDALNMIHTPPDVLIAKSVSKVHSLGVEFLD